MRAKQGFRSRSIDARVKEAEALLTQKLGTVYATLVSGEGYVSINSSIVTPRRINIVCDVWNG